MAGNDSECRSLDCVRKDSSLGVWSVFQFMHIIRWPARDDVIRPVWSGDESFLSARAVGAKRAVHQIRSIGLAAARGASHDHNGGGLPLESARRYKLSSSA